MMYANREPLASAPRAVSTKPIASANAAWSSGGRGGLVADRLDRDAVVLAAVGHVGGGRVRHLQRELAQLRLGRGERLLLRLRARPSSPRRARSSPARSSGAALPISFDAVFCSARSASVSCRSVRSRRRTRRAPRRSGRRARACARCRAGTPARRAAACRSITRRRPGSARADASTHADACFHALPTTLRGARRRPRPDRRRDTSRGTSPRPAWRERLRNASATTSSATWPSQSMKKQ